MTDLPRPPTARRDEGSLSIWSRRAVSIPLYVVLAAFYFATSPLWLVMGALVDIATGKRRTLPRVRALTFFAVYLACEVAGVAGAALLWLFTGGGRFVGPRRYVELNAALQRLWTRALFGGAVVVFSMRVEVDGLEHARRGPLLLFVRHSSTADTALTAALVANPNRLLLRYVLKRELLWDPCIDIVGRRLPNAFVDRSASRSHAEVEAVKRLADGIDASSAVLIYPEGTRFTPAKLEERVTALRQRGDAQLVALAETYRHVLPPRLGGPLALIDAAPGVDVVFVEHTGFDGVPSFAKFWNGALVRKTIRVRLRRVAAAAIPTTARDRWLFAQWLEMDGWISANAGSLDHAA